MKWIRVRLFGKGGKQAGWSGGWVNRLGVELGLKRRPA